MATRRTVNDKQTPIANPGEYDSDKALYEFQFGAYADTEVYVWADGDEDAFEIAVEWADDNAKGVFTTLTEADLKEAAEDLGIEWDPMWDAGGLSGRKAFGTTWSPFDDKDYSKIVEHAEADLTVIGHTQLNSGQYIHSDEWHFHEVTDESEIDEVVARSEDDEDDGEVDERVEEGPVDDPEYVIQGLYDDGQLVSGGEFGYDDEGKAIAEAKKLARDPIFEGDHVRVITRDGELVWDSLD